MFSRFHRGVALLPLLPVLILIIGLATSVIVTQSPQHISTQAANGDLCRANDFNCYPNSYYCQYTYPQFNDCNAGYKCGYNCATPTSTPRPPINTPVPPTNTPRPPTATPIPACSGQCIPNGEYCYDLGTGYCQPNFICCDQVDPPPTPTRTPTPRPPTSTPTRTPTPIRTPTPTPKCSGLCIPNGETCYQTGTGYCPPYYICCNQADPTLSPIRTPTPTPISRSQCTYANGIAWCTQANSTWRYNHFPGGCPDPTKDYLYKAACGQSVVSSILCTYVGNHYCNLETVMSEVTQYQYSTCRGIAMNVNRDVLQSPQFSASQQTVELTPPITWSKINQNLAYGQVILGAKFQLNDIPGRSWINHTTLITGITNGKHVFNDPYFNSDNPENLYKIRSQYLEDYLNIDLTNATALSVRPR